MFQSIPSEAHYRALERDLTSRGESTSLTLQQLQDEQIERIQAGYKTYTGYVFNQADADAINVYVDELNSTRCKIRREFLKDKKHQYFVIIAEQLSAGDIRQLSQPKKS